MSDQELDFADAALELYPPWKEALKAFARDGKTYGDTVTRAWFEQAIGMEEIDGAVVVSWAQAQEALKRRELHWLQQWTSFKSAVLEECQMDLVSDRAGAYIIIAPKDQADRALRTMSADIQRDVKRGVARVRNTNIAMLTASERQHLMDVMAKVADLANRLNTRRALPMDDDAP